MEMCDKKITADSKIKIETEEESVQKLERHLGKLLVVLELAGIPVAERRNRNKVLGLLQQLCFPVFLHLSCLYLLYERITKGGLNYETVIDVILPILPCVMWLMVRCQHASLKSFLTSLSGITSENFKSLNRSLSYSTNAALFFIIIYPLLLVGMRFLQENVVNTKEVFRILQEAIFPNLVAVVYIAICYLLLQKLRFCKKMFDKKLDLTCPTAGNMMQDYINTAKCVKSFESLLCNIIFVILLHDLCIVTILIIDMFYLDGDEFVSKILFEALSEMSYVFLSLGIMSICAGNVSVEMAAIKSVLSEKAFAQLDQDNLAHNEKRSNLLVKMDACVLTVAKAVVFDRGFMIKLLLALFAEVIFICEVVVFNR